MHYNHMFIIINGRPVAYADQVGEAELKAAGFTRISGEFNGESQDPAQAVAVAMPAPPKRDDRGPVPV